VLRQLLRLTLNVKVWFDIALQASLFNKTVLRNQGFAKPIIIHRTATQKRHRTNQNVAENV